MMELARAFINNAKENLIPLNSTIEITKSCNLACMHCYNFDRRGKNTTHQIEMMQEDIAFNVIDQLTDLGCLFINLTGGEALVHPGVFNIISHIKNNHSVARLKTNGILLSTKIDKLKNHGLDEIDLSIYGASEDTYEKFCHKRGFNKVKDGIESALRLDIHLTLNIVLHKYNVDELDTMISMAHDYGLKPNISTEMTARYDGTTSSTGLAVTKEQFQELLRSPYGEIFKVVKDDIEDLSCPCAITNCAIAANGDVYPCIGAPIVAGNLKRSSLKHIWRASDVFDKIRNSSFKDYKKCSSCNIIKDCDRSSGSAYCNTSDYFAPDPQSCAYAEIRSGKKVMFSNDLNDSHL